jgi:hypothetical protein
LQIVFSPFIALGHDFNRAERAAESSWALQAAEKLDLAPISGGFVTGHDFSRAASAIKSTWALAPEGCLSGFSPRARPFSAACKAHPLFSAFCGTVENGE